MNTRLSQECCNADRMLACGQISAEGAAGAEARVDVQGALGPFGPLPPLRAPQAVPPRHRNALCFFKIKNTNDEKVRQYHLKTGFYPLRLDHF